MSRPNFEEMKRDELVKWLLSQDVQASVTMRKDTALELCLEKWALDNPGAEPVEVAEDDADLDVTADEDAEEDDQVEEIDEDQAERFEAAVEDVEGSQEAPAGDESQEDEEDDLDVVLDEDDVAADEDLIPAAPVEEPVGPIIPELARPDGYSDKYWEEILARWETLRDDLRPAFEEMIRATGEFLRLESIVPPNPPPAPPGMVNLYAPTKDGTCSYGGATYEIKDYVVRVPFDAIVELAAHGFRTSF